MSDTPPTGPMATPQAQAAVADTMAYCRAGDCKYADTRRSRQTCEQDLDARCLGYQGHVYIELGQPVLRWSRCPHFRAWWTAEKDRIQRRREDEARAKRGRAAGPPPREWSAE